MSESAAKTTVPGGLVHPIVMQYRVTERRKPGLLWSLTHCTGHEQTDSISVAEGPKGTIIATFPDVYTLMAWGSVFRRWWGYCPKGKEVFQYSS